jgi:hypothetical protein
MFKRWWRDAVDLVQSARQALVGSDGASHPLVRAEVQEPLKAAELHPNFEDPRWMRQNSGELGTELGETTLDEERVLADDSAPHQAIQSQGDYLVAVTEGESLGEQRELAEAIAVSSVEEAEYERQAADHDDDRRRAEGQRDDKDQEHESIGNTRSVLDVAKRGDRYDWVWLAIASLGIIGTDTVLATVVFMLVPGTTAQHWMLGALVGLMLAVFSEVLGWVLSRAYEVATKQVRVAFWAALVISLIGLLVWFVDTMQSFRAEAFVRLVQGNLVALDPTFFGPLQFLLAAVGTVASFRYHLAAEGRALLRRGLRVASEAAGFDAAAQVARKGSRAALAKAFDARVAGARAQAALPYVRDRAAKTIEGLIAQTQFSKEFFDVMFFLRRYRVDPPAVIPTPVSPEAATADYTFRLGRLRDVAMLALAALALAVAVVALALGYLWAALAAVVASIAHVLVWLAMRKADRTPSGDINDFLVTDQRSNDHKTTIPEVSK